MSKRLIVVLERPVGGQGQERGEPWGTALARVVEAHPALESLLDFAPPDPLEIAQQVGMTYPYDPDEAEDLAEINFGPEEWFEPAAGLVAVRAALGVLLENPQGVAAAIYDPGLRAADVIADLEACERMLLTALHQETRFHFAWAS